ncbi:hypothetical protein HK102_002834 [Quaeritorhiza haematococci]|nr:hypothetical protein HK102_002834 [Quaeritorhiza haematococci]
MPHKRKRNPPLPSSPLPAISTVKGKAKELGATLFPANLLPIDILYVVLEFLSVDSLRTIELVCRQWRAAAPIAWHQACQLRWSGTRWKQDELRINRFLRAAQVPLVVAHEHSLPEILSYRYLKSPSSAWKCYFDARLREVNLNYWSATHSLLRHFDDFLVDDQTYKCGMRVQVLENRDHPRQFELAKRYLISELGTAIVEDNSVKSLLVKDVIPSPHHPAIFRIINRNGSMVVALSITGECMNDTSPGDQDQPGISSAASQEETSPEESTPREMSVSIHTDYQDMLCADASGEFISTCGRMYCEDEIVDSVLDQLNTPTDTRSSRIQRQYLHGIHRSVWHAAGGAHFNRSLRCTCFQKRQEQSRLNVDGQTATSVSSPGHISDPCLHHYCHQLHSTMNHDRCFDDQVLAALKLQVAQRYIVRNSYFDHQYDAAGNLVQPRIYFYTQSFVRSVHLVMPRPPISLSPWKFSSDPCEGLFQDDSTFYDVRYPDVSPFSPSISNLHGATTSGGKTTGRWKNVGQRAHSDRSSDSVEGGPSGVTLGDMPPMPPSLTSTTTGTSVYNSLLGKANPASSVASSSSVHSSSDRRDYLRRKADLSAHQLMPELAILRTLSGQVVCVLVETGQVIDVWDALEKLCRFGVMNVKTLVGELHKVALNVPVEDGDLGMVSEE